MSAEQPSGRAFTDGEISDVLRGLVLVVAEQSEPRRVTELFDLAYRVEIALRAVSAAPELARVERSEG